MINILIVATIIFDRLANKLAGKKAPPEWMVIRVLENRKRLNIKVKS
jgi:hypothetical protein